MYNERLKWLRNCKNITQKEIAKSLRIKQQQYAITIRKFTLKI